MARQGDINKLEEPLWAVVYPINGDGSDVAQAYIDSLTVADFADIDAFMAEEAQRYGVAIAQPVETHLSDQVRERPPESPRGGNILQLAWWSLKLRYWAYRFDNFDVGASDIRIFALYYDPATTTVARDSFGLAQGMIAVTHLFATRKMAQSNNVVIAHEMLHTLGATDKYDPSNNYPLFPNGFADPEQSPLLPQQWAEIMGGRLPISDSVAEIPRSLSDTLIGELTAAEIRFFDPD